MRSLTWDEVRSRRLARSNLHERAPAERLVEVVRYVGGIHAQVMGSAELQLAARVEGITQEDVRGALWERRELAKTWTLRGTLHLHPADELRLWTAARRAIVGAADHEADSLENVDAVVEAIGDALAGRSLLREDLADAVAASVGEGPRQQLASGWGYFLGDAAIADRLCFGPPQGQKVMFVHPPEYDVYVMGFRERDQLVPAAVREQVAAHGKGRYEGPAGTPFLLVEGICAGIWSRKKRARRIELTVVPARKLTRDERAGVAAEAERIGAFLGLEPVVSIV